MKTIVIGDCHGDWKGLLAILRATGGIDAENRRLPGTTVIQLGDLIHGGDPRGAPRDGVDDELCAALALGLCDTILIGNHELPHLWPDAGFPTFGGQRPIAPVLRDALLSAYRDGKLVPAYAHERWLLTHAGTTNTYINECRDAADAAERLCVFFRRRLENRQHRALFDAVGPARGGHDLHGGIFWSDWSELALWSTPDLLLPQIFGHTPQPEGWSRHGDSWCVDAGAALSGRVSAIVQDEAGAEWRPVVVESE